MNRKEKGYQGEQLAQEYLEKKGYTILHKNWRHHPLEVDLIAQKEDIISFVEVKFRETDYYGSPASGVSQKQQKNLIQAAEYFVQAQNIEEEIHFDILEIVAQPKLKFNHIQQAFFDES